MVFRPKSRVGRSLLFALSIGIFLTTVSVTKSWAQPSGAEQKQEEIKFLWAFGALVQDGSARKLEPITRDRALRSGDKLKMLVEPLPGSFVYVIYFNSHNEASLLFPYNLDQPSANYGTSKRYLIPQGEAWFELDRNTGLETFHLLASDQRLTELEALLKRRQAADAASQPEIAKQILAEIRRVKRERKELASPAERPVNLGGVIRGDGRPPKISLPDIASITQEITASGFFSRAFTIEHQP